MNHTIFFISINIQVDLTMSACEASRKQSVGIDVSRKRNKQEVNGLLLKKSHRNIDKSFPFYFLL